jgi:hypothetical protein
MRFRWLGLSGTVLVFIAGTACVPVSECGYDRVDAGVVTAGPRVQGKTDPFPRRQLTDAFERNAACTNLCRAKLPEGAFGKYSHQPESDAAKSCTTTCVADAELYWECRQIGTDWPTFGIPY